MRRKVIQLAGSTFVVTLPNSWVKQWGVEKGEELHVVESGPRLFLSTAEAREVSSGSVNISDVPERAARWVLSSLNKKGYDEIEVITDSEKHAQLINELVKDLFLGFAIVDRSEKKCTIRALSKEFDDQFDVILRRAFLVTINLAESVHERVSKGEFEELPKLHELEKTNNQLTNFCERLLNKRGHADPVKTNFMYVIVWNLEKIADEYKYLCRYLADKKKVGRKTVDEMKKVNGLLREYYELFYAFDMKKLSDLSKKFKDSSERLKEVMVKSDDAVVLSHLLHITLKTADFSASTVAIHR